GRPRSSRRAARGSRSGSGSALAASAGGGAARARGPARARSQRMAEDVRLAGHARARAHPKAVDVPAGARGRPGPGAGGGFARAGDPHASIDQDPGSLESLLELSARQKGEGQADAPWPPHYAKQEDEPPRVQPSKKRKR